MTSLGCPDDRFLRNLGERRSWYAVRIGHPAVWLKPGRSHLLFRQHSKWPIVSTPTTGVSCPANGSIVLFLSGKFACQIPAI